MPVETFAYYSAPVKVRGQPVEGCLLEGWGLTSGSCEGQRKTSGRLFAWGWGPTSGSGFLTSVDLNLLLQNTVVFLSVTLRQTDKGFWLLLWEDGSL